MWQFEQATKLLQKLQRKCVRMNSGTGRLFHLTAWIYRSQLCRSEGASLGAIFTVKLLILWIKSDDRLRERQKQVFDECFDIKTSFPIIKLEFRHPVRNCTSALKVVDPNCKPLLILWIKSEDRLRERRNRFLWMLRYLKRNFRSLNWNLGTRCETALAPVILPHWPERIAFGPHGLV